MYKCIFILTMFALSTIMLSGCNTVDGFGQDLQQAGRSIDRAAD